MLFSLSLLVAVAACSPADPDDGVVARNAGQNLGGSPLVAFEDLTERDDVLINLEFAYNGRDLNEFHRLLDPDFVFHFGASDISEGTVPITDWPRPDEVESAMATFFKLEVPTGIRPVGGPEPAGQSVEQATWGALKYAFHQGNLICAEAISLSLSYPPGEFSWTNVPAPPPFTGEIWYEKTVVYSLTINADDITFTTGPLNASFVIRLTSFYGDTIYRLVDWRDDL